MTPNTVEVAIRLALRVRFAPTASARCNVRLGKTTAADSVSIHPPMRNTAVVVAPFAQVENSVVLADVPAQMVSLNASGVASMLNRTRSIVVAATTAARRGKAALLESVFHSALRAKRIATEPVSIFKPVLHIVVNAVASALAGHPARPVCVNAQRAKNSAREFVSMYKPTRLTVVNAGGSVSPGKLAKSANAQALARREQACAVQPAITSRPTANTVDVATMLASMEKYVAMVSVRAHPVRLCA